MDVIPDILPGAGFSDDLAALLAVLGAGLYLRRDRSVSPQEQEKRIFGDLLRR